MEVQSVGNQLSKSNQWTVDSPEHMAELGARLAHRVRRGCCMYFEGDLGAGKTTLIQAIMRNLGVEEPIPSPTFSIMETYRTPGGLELLHIDLYRIEMPQELVLIGLDEFRKDDYAWFIEWPQNGAEIIPAADVRVCLQHAGTSRKVKTDPMLVTN